MAASYTVNGGYDYANVVITPDPAFLWYRIYIKDTDTDEQIYDDFYAHEITETTIVHIANLPVGGNYTINVGYNNTGSNGVTWIGSQTFQTGLFYGKVVYDANGGSGAPAAQTDSSTTGSIFFTVPETKPTRSGFTFLGWALSDDVTVAAYEPGDTMLVISDSHDEDAPTTETLFAVWVTSVTYYYARVTFDANGGTGAPEAVSGRRANSVWVMLEIPETTPTKDGAVFLGWALDDDATEAEYLAGDTAPFKGQTDTYKSYTLYAVWYESEYGVRMTYVPIDESGEAGVRTYYHSTENVPVLMPTITKDGFRHLGWSTNPDAETPEYEEGETYDFTGAYDDLEHYVLYAIFAELHYVTLHYNANGGAGAPDSETFDDIDNAITVTISQVIPTRTGFVFLGWSFNRTAATAEYAAGGTYYNWLGSPDGTEVTLYAVWSVLDGFGGVWINGEYYYPWIYHNGWHRAAAHVNHNGWSITKEGT